MTRKRRTAGAHRKDGQGPGPSPGPVWDPGRLAEETRRQEAAQITGRLAGVLVMWSGWHRAFVAFGWWGFPLVAGDLAELENEINAAYTDVRQEG